MSSEREDEVLEGLEEGEGHQLGVLEDFQLEEAYPVAYPADLKASQVSSLEVHLDSKVVRDLAGEAYQDAGEAFLPVVVVAAVTDS